MNLVKILILGINYAPELTGIGKYTGEMARYLAGKGHDVRVITAPPYYPNWQVSPEFRGKGFWCHDDGGVKVYRVPIWVPRRPSGVKRLLHLLSFSMAAAPVVLRHLSWRPSVVWTVEPSLMSAPLALALAKIVRGRSWLHIQDYEVDAAFELNLLKGNLAKKLARKFDRWLMSKFDRVSSISEKMVDRAQELGVESGRLYLFRNWVNVGEIQPFHSVSRFRSLLNIPEQAIVALYSGNMGGKQGLEIIPLAASQLVYRSDVYFVICGNGSGKEQLMELSRGIANVRFLDLQPLADLNELLGMADIHLLPQKASAASLVMPSKLTGMFASGRPVIATASPGTQLATTLAGRGLIAEPECVEDLVQKIIDLVDDPSLRRRLGAAGREYAENELSDTSILRRFDVELHRLANVEDIAI